MMRRPVSAAADARAAIAVARLPWRARPPIAAATTTAAAAAATAAAVVHVDAVDAVKVPGGVGAAAAAA